MATGGAFVTTLFVLLVFASPSKDVHFLFITYPAKVNALVSLVSFGVSGIYLSFLLTVIAAIVARSRGWVAEGRFTLGRWGWPVLIIAAGLPRPDAHQRGGTDRVVEPTRVLQPRLDHPAGDGGRGRGRDHRVRGGGERSRPRRANASWPST